MELRCMGPSLFKVGREERRRLKELERENREFRRANEILRKIWINPVGYRWTMMSRETADP